MGAVPTSFVSQSLEGSLELGGQGVKLAHLWCPSCQSPDLPMVSHVTWRVLSAEQVGVVSLGFLLEAGSSWSWVSCPLL